MSTPGTTDAQRILEALPPPGEDVDTATLAERTGLARRRVSDAVAILVRHGLAARDGRGAYRLTDSGCLARQTGQRVTSGPNGPTGPRPPRPGALRSRIWQALRKERKSTVDGLLELAARDDELAPDRLALTRANAQRYLAALVRAGLVSELAVRSPGTAPTSNGFKRFLLIRDLGPKAPTWNPKTGVLRDPNRNEIVGGPHG